MSERANVSDIEVEHNDSGEITFRACTEAGEIWLRANAKGTEVTRSGEKALELRSNAIASGLTVTGQL